MRHEHMLGTALTHQYFGPSPALPDKRQGCRILRPQGGIFRHVKPCPADWFQDNGNTDRAKFRAKKKTAPPSKPGLNDQALLNQIDFHPAITGLARAIRRVDGRLDLAERLEADSILG